MATFSVKPTEGQDPWGATDLAWRASVESAVNGVEGTANAALPIKGVLGNVNLNTVVAPGIYRLENSAFSTAANGYPVEGCRWIVEVMAWDASGAPVQRLTPATGGPEQRVIYQRRQTNVANNLWSNFTALPTRRVDTTAGRAFYGWDTLAGRDQLDATSDSGVRDITSMFAEVTSGKVYVVRSGYSVTLAFVDVVLGSLAGSVTLAASLPASLSPVFPASGALVTGATDTTVRATVGMTGQVRLWNVQAGQATNGVVLCRTNAAWPTTLPGTAVGSIPNA